MTESAKAYVFAARLAAGAILAWLMAAALVEGFPELDLGLQQAMADRGLDALAAAGAFSVLWLALRRGSVALNPFCATASILVLVALLLNGLM
ncbi:MAG: hypothetical protein ACK5QX_07035, partial [bacterium]